MISITSPVFVSAFGINVSHDRNKTRRYSPEKRNENVLYVRTCSVLPGINCVNKYANDLDCARMVPNAN